MSVTKILAATTLIALGASAASAQSSFEEVGMVEGWNVWKDMDNQSCMIERKDGPNVVQMGLTKDHAIGYLGVFTQNETDIKEGEIQELQIIVGDNYYKGESKGMRANVSNGYTGGYFRAEVNSNLATDIAKQYTMTVFPGAEYAFIINLDGTLKAMEAARECNESF
ncbi:MULTISPECIES: hypothetical protein [Falsihalocynthiibacter]|uniref:hypothetical protein n=1 Tax=Falsihalocynthiibacter TaxID=2854182 RepID=UPI003001D089